MVLLAVGLTTAYAGNADRVGTAGAQELRIPVGSRGTAMGGAVIANARGVESMFWNPAGLASLEGTEAMFSYLPYIADIDQNYVGAAIRIEEFGTIGAGAKVMSVGDIDETTQQFPDGTGRQFSPSLAVINLTYARNLTANVSFGLTSMFINEQIAEVKATGIAFDVGFMYDPGWNGVRLGLVLKNYGPEMKFTGRGFERSLNGLRPASPESEAFDLPASINIGMSYDFLAQDEHLACLTGNFRSSSFGADLFQGGIEYGFNDLYFIRAGYNYADQPEWVSGVTLGGGLTYAFGDAKLTFEYAWQETDVFDDRQYFTLSVGF
jgi:hypothetical protein